MDVNSKEFARFIYNVVGDKKLRATEKAALLALAVDPAVQDNNIVLAEKIGVSLPTAANAVRKLHQLGYIEVTYITDGHTSPQRKIEVKNDTN